MSASGAAAVPAARSAAVAGLPWPRGVKLAIAVLAGAALALAFAPLSLWPLAVAAPAVLVVLWQGASPRLAAALGFCFNFATFAAGTYWLYTSIHGFGEAPIWMALGLMLGLVGIMALYGAGLGYGVARFLPASGALRWMVAIPAAWVIIEWWRGWFLTGFPWMSLGYTQTGTWLSGYAPLAGVYGISALILVGAGALVTLAWGTRAERLAAVALTAAMWLFGWPLARVDWTHIAGAPVRVAIVQGAIPQDQKWLDSNRDRTLTLYGTLTGKALGDRVIVWPEAAAPDLINNLMYWLTALYREAHKAGSALVIGVVREDEGLYYNSILSLGAHPEWYNKHHLVPFAEFFPVPRFVRSWLRLMDLPYTDFERGAADQPPLDAGGLVLDASICYDDAYGSSMLPQLTTADALVNVTNDAWFGHSSARYQHLQIAQMRAQETGRFMLRAANDGISAVIGPHGRILAEAPQYRPVVLQALVTPYLGLTPYARVGNWLIISLAAATLAGLIALRLLRLTRAGGVEAASAARGGYTEC